MSGKAFLGLGVIAGVLVILAFRGKAKPAPPPPEIPPEPIPGLANLYGQITDKITGNPIPVVVIHIDTFPHDGESVVTTNQKGNYSVELVPGNYLANFEKKGYKFTRAKITLHEGENKLLNIELEPLDIVPILPPSPLPVFNWGQLVDIRGQPEDIILIPVPTVVHRPRGMVVEWQLPSRPWPDYYPSRVTGIYLRVLSYREPYSSDEGYDFGPFFYELTSPPPPKDTYVSTEVTRVEKPAYYRPGVYSYILQWGYELDWGYGVDIRGAVTLVNIINCTGEGKVE